MKHVLHKILLVQLPVPNNPATNTPLAAGYLKAAAAGHGLLDTFQIDILPRSIADHAGDAAIVAAIVASAPALLGFSLYTWNSERSLAIAARAKQQLPDLIVIGGGPEVQPENEWLLSHPGLDLAVVGEGEQTFVALLQHWHDHVGSDLLALPMLDQIAGLIYATPTGKRIQTAPRVAMNDLAGLASPYLSGYLDLAAGDMLMVEVSRWCPYSCSFCLYGRNMGPRLGNRYFATERILAEIAWGLERGITRIHFIEANLNLVPPFRELMAALAELNHDRRLELYAELRGEHLSESVVADLVRAGLRVAEVGLQTANPLALRAAQRRTDLAKWAAGTRRLYAQGVEVLLDVILGLPADDAAGVAETLDFLEREQLGHYDIFTLQVLPGTAVRQEAEHYQLAFQQQPPYYVLGTDRMSYQELRQLRRTLKQGADLDPDAIEGCPLPRFAQPHPYRPTAEWVESVERVDLRMRSIDQLLDRLIDQLAAHIDLLAAAADLPVLHDWLSAAIRANPSMLIDLYLFASDDRCVPEPARLHDWRDHLPFVPGYLDRVAVYQCEHPEPAYLRVSPRIWLVVPWSSQIEPEAYRGVAEILWRYELQPDEPPPWEAWARAGGAGIWLEPAVAEQVRQANSTAVAIWADIA
ncbi:MAG: hypothetical protein Fur005_07540 [Roseiflexaceae bacterium]